MPVSNLFKSKPKGKFVWFCFIIFYNFVLFFFLYIKELNNDEEKKYTNKYRFLITHI